MSIEKIRNRDLFFKIVLFVYISHILNVLGIDEKIKEILSTELITMELKNIAEIFDNFMDFKILTESGKIIIFEFKKGIIRKKDLKQLYDYYKRVECEERREVIPILITISKFGKLKWYRMDYCTFHPQIIKTKCISKQKDLNMIRKKLENNESLTSKECSLLVTLPLFATDNEESDLVREVCGYIRNKSHCIPDGEYRNMVIPMYLNIVEYIDEDKQENLMEDINMTGEVRGVFAEIRHEAEINGKIEGKKEGKIEGKKELLESLLKNCSIDELASLCGISVSEINDILNSRF